MQLIALFTIWNLCCYSVTIPNTAPSYMKPEYKIHYKDTSGTYIRILNYFDRSFYQHNIVLKEHAADSFTRISYITIDTVTGYGKLTDLDKNYELRIDRTLMIDTINIIKNKVCQIEIRDTKGFINLQAKNNGQQMYPTGYLIDSMRQDSIPINLPFQSSLATGKYALKLETTPPIVRTIYLKPAAIFFKEFYSSVKVSLMNKEGYFEYTLYAATRPYTDWRMCSTGHLTGAKTTLYLQPNYLYRIHFKKKGRKKAIEKTFYINSNMKHFIYTLEKINRLPSD